MRNHVMGPSIVGGCSQNFQILILLPVEFSTLILPALDMPIINQDGDTV